MSANPSYRSWWCDLDRAALNEEARRRAPQMSARDMTAYRFNPNRNRIKTIAEEIDEA